MATKKISELEVATVVENDDVLPFVDVSEEKTKKIRKDDFLFDIASKIGIAVTTYDESSIYNIDDIVINNETIYKCKADDVTGEFDITKWNEISLYEYIDEVESDVTDFKNEQKVETANGEFIYIEDAADAKFRKFRITGKDWQNSTTGKQLFKEIQTATQKGVTLTNNGDGSYTLNGTASESFNFVLNNNLIEAGDYSLQCKFQGTLPNNSSPRVQLYSSSASVALNVSNNASSDSVSNLSLASNITDGSFRIRIDNGFTYNNVKLYPMLAKGTYTSSTMPECEKYTGRNSKP